MTKLHALLAAIALFACGCSPARTVEQTETREVEHARLPFDNSTDILDGYSLTVNREGDIFWNGAMVTDAMLKEYLQQWSAKHRNAGGLFVAFEPGVLAVRAEWVRWQVIDSGLCKQRRCWEVGWNVKRPVVN